MVSAKGVDSIDDPHGFFALGHVSRGFLAFGCDQELVRPFTDKPGSTLGTFGEGIAKALAEGNLFDHLDNGIGVSEAQLNPVGILQVIRPFSKHSMAKEMVAPQEMVSIPYQLHSWLARATASMLSLPQYEPKVAMVSYSGPPKRSDTCRPLYSVSTTRLQRTAHE